MAPFGQFFGRGPFAVSLVTCKRYLLIRCRQTDIPNHYKAFCL
jgi:hypothetical protein